MKVINESEPAAVLHNSAVHSIHMIIIDKVIIIYIIVNLEHIKSQHHADIVIYFDYYNLAR